MANENYSKNSLSRIYVKESITPFVETDGYFIPLDMNVNRNTLEWLIAGLKTSADNLGILHRNIIRYRLFQYSRDFRGILPSCK